MGAIDLSVVGELSGVLAWGALVLVGVVLIRVRG
jgi:hypothetical protein